MFESFLPSLRKRSALTSRPASIADLMESFWSDPFGMFPLNREMAYPAVDVRETDKEVVVKAELPGMDHKDVEITLDGDILTIKGEKKFEEETKKDNYHRMERGYGSFSRQISLPVRVKEDQVQAKFKKGILTISLPKSEENRGKKIAIES